jgi:V8-like Glu-specific endopeptidase
MKDDSYESAAKDPALEESNRIVYEGLVGADDMLSVQFIHRGSQVAQCVGRIVTMPHLGANGTGFLISPRLLMTNHHVLTDLEDAENNIVQFEYGDTPGGVPIPFRFRPAEFFRTSGIDELDCTIVAIEPSNEGLIQTSRFGWCSLAPDENALQVAERVNIIHHPAGALKQVSIRDNFVAGEEPEGHPKYWLYASDTKRGSSGSPVFNEEWQVVALHHASVEVDDEEEVDAYHRILQTRGVAGLDPEAETIELNEGIRMDLISDWLADESRQFSAQEAALYDEFQQLKTLSPNVSPRLIDESSRRTVFLPKIGDDGLVSVPLNLNFYLGEYRSGFQPFARDVTERTVRRDLELFKNQVGTQKSIFTALSFLQNHRETDYLPGNQAMQERREDYYGDLIADVANDQLTPAELYEELHTLSVENLEIVNRFPESMRELDSLVGERTDLESMRILESSASYARARAHLYTNVDLQPHRMLECPYTGAIIAPEQLLLLDLIKDLGQFDLLPQRFRNNRYLNCEHIVPQSWFKEQHPDGVSDLHHLIAADGGANNFRSACPYRVLNGQGEFGPENNPSYIPKAGHKLDGFFEPANGKHILARATLYFLITYKGALDSSRYSSSDIEVLKSWARATAPNDYERHRNEGAFEAQGNRNPLIDFPDWVDLIEFSEGLG